LLGKYLNTQKSKILTVTTHQPSSLSLSPSQTLELQQALSLLYGPSSETTTGARHLGITFGPTVFAQSLLNTTASTFKNTLHKLSHRIYDCQTMASLYCHFAIPSLSHLLVMGVYHHTELNSPPTSFAWHSPFDTATQHNQHAGDSFLMKLMDQQQPFNPLSWLLAHTPIPAGGTSFHDHCNSAIISFLIPLAQSFCYASSGIEIQDTSLSIPTIYSRPLFCMAKISSSDLPILPFSTSWSHTISTIQDTKHQACYIQFSRSYLKWHTNQPTTCHHQKQILLLDHITNPTPNYEAALPPLLSPLTALPLTSLAHQNKDTHIPNDIFTIVLQQKLHLPLLPRSLQKTTACPRCHKILDPYGDHFFTCCLFPKLQSTTTSAIHYLPFAKLLALLLASPFHQTILSLNLQTFFQTIISVDPLMLHFAFTPPQQTLVKLLPSMLPSLAIPL
jgi:hypothetical protein